MTFYDHSSPPHDNHPTDEQIDEQGYPTHKCNRLSSCHRVLDCPYHRDLDRYWDWAYNPARS